MNIFTRLSATIGASAESAVSRFENHDAIAQSALVEARQAVAKARIRHKRLCRSVEAIRSTLEESEQQEQQWTRRAKALASSDEARALLCLEQRQQCREQIESHTKNLREHQELEASMAHRLQQMETRLQQMNQQCAEMRSRESLAKATHVMDKIDNKGSTGVDAVFERWELSISDSEIHNEAQCADVSGVSSLQREMDEEERLATLKAELATLTLDDEDTTHD